MLQCTRQTNSSLVFQEHEDSSQKLMDNEASLQVEPGVQDNLGCCLEGEGVFPALNVPPLRGQPHLRVT